MREYPTELLEEDTEFVFFVYSDTQDDPRFSLWAQRPEWGVSMYERNPEDSATWQKLDRDADYDEIEPTDELRGILHDFAKGKRVDARVVKDLPAHEEYFIRALHGTDRENPSAIPEPVIEWMRRLGDNEGLDE